MKQLSPSFSAPTLSDKYGAYLTAGLDGNPNLAEVAAAARDVVSDLTERISLKASPTQWAR